MKTLTKGTNMSFSDFELIEIKDKMDQYINKIRPEEKMRPELDIFYKIDKQSVEIYEIRQLPGHKRQSMSQIAKATYIRTGKLWYIFWMRADEKWHKYEPVKEVKSIDEFIKVVEEDIYGCFWG